MAQSSSFRSERQYIFIKSFLECYVLRHKYQPSVVEFLEIVEYFVKMWTLSWRLDGRLSVEYFGPQFWSKYVRASREDFFDLVMSDAAPKDIEWGKNFKDFIQVHYSVLPT